MKRSDFQRNQKSIVYSKDNGKYRIIIRSFDSERVVDSLPLELPDEDQVDAFLDYIDNVFSEGGFSNLNIINMDEFFEKLGSVLSGNDIDEP